MDPSPDRHITGSFTTAICLTAVTLAAEVAGALWSNSLALLSDAAHVFFDLFALILSLAAVRLSAMPASEQHTFGYHRFEVFASFINGATVFAMGLGILYEAWGRFSAPEPVKALPMLTIAAAGLVMNLLAARVLHHHSHDDLNIKSAFLHVIGDAAASVGVIIGAAVMHVTGWSLPDAIISVGIGLLILSGAGRILRDSIHILMEGTPRGLELTDVAEAIRGVDGVKDVHHLNIWTVCSHIIALSVHIDSDAEFQGERSVIMHRIEHLLAEKYHITHTTIQMDCSACMNGPVIRDLKHRPRPVCGHDH